MGNKKKRLYESATNKDHGSSVPPQPNDRMMSAALNNIADSIKIKQESDIKREPVSVAGLVEVSASTYRNVSHVPGSNGSNAEYDFDYSSLYEPKVEVKKDCADEKEEEPKTSVDSDEDATNGQRDQQPSPQDENNSLQPESGNVTHNTPERAGDAPENPRKRHKCDICEYSAQFKCDLNRHLLKHTGEKPHGCDFCAKRFTRKGGLRAHMKAHVEEFLFHCSGCMQGFDEKIEKMAHEKNCKFRCYECHLCKESFGSLKSNMMNHMRVHSGDKPFECKECYKQFTEKGSLNTHMKLHAGPSSFRCSKCRQGLSQQDEKNAHEKKCRRHAYECDICGKIFGLQKSHLIPHMRTHTGEKPFQCKECTKKYTEKGNLKKHMKIHSKKFQFECLVCRQRFLKDIKRKAHQRNCNGRYYECYLCKKFFHSAFVNLKNHMRTHSARSQSSAKCVATRLHGNRV